MVDSSFFSELMSADDMRLLDQKEICGKNRFLWHLRYTAFLPFQSSDAETSLRSCGLLPETLRMTSEPLPPCMPSSKPSTKRRSRLKGVTKKKVYTSWLSTPNGERSTLQPLNFFWPKTQALGAMGSKVRQRTRFLACWSDGGKRKPVQRKTCQERHVCI